MWSNHCVAFLQYNCIVIVFNCILIYLAPSLDVNSTRMCLPTAPLMFRRNLVFPLTDRNERSPIVRNKYRLSYKLLRVIYWESVPGAKSCGQSIWLKLDTEVGCDEIFQKPLWLTSLTFSFGVTGGVSFFSLWAPKSSLPGAFLKVW